MRMSVNEGRIYQVLHLRKVLRQGAHVGAERVITWLLLVRLLHQSLDVCGSVWERTLVLSLFLAAPFCSPALGLSDAPSLKDCAIFLINAKNQ